MGVKHLWDLIDEVKHRETLDVLRGKVIAVDLSIWIVEAVKTLQFNRSILKPHLRNLFFRIAHLRRLGVKLIFVTEGEAPELKQATMKQRNIERYGEKATTRKKVGRSRFQRTIDECCQLLDLLGIPHLRAAGEAEQLCAFLNHHGYVDGCLTNDSDFFLYGGKHVYRDFGVNPKDPHVIIYNSEQISDRLGMSREDMIGVGVLCGCDYTKGVPGVGRVLLEKLINDAREFPENLIERFGKWHEDGFFRYGDASKTEITIAKKAFKVEDFMDQKVVDEFIQEKDKHDGIAKKLRWRYPSIKMTQEFLLTKLEWPEEYTLSKVLQMATNTYIQKLHDKVEIAAPIQPKRVVKTRCRNGVPLVEVEWEMCADPDLAYGDRWKTTPELFVTLEDQNVFHALLPDLVEEFTKAKNTKKVKGKTSSKSKSVKKDNSEDEQLENLDPINDNPEIPDGSNDVSRYKKDAWDLGDCFADLNLNDENKIPDFMVHLEDNFTKKLNINTDESRERADKPQSNLLERCMNKSKKQGKSVTKENDLYIKRIRAKLDSAVSQTKNDEISSPKTFKLLDDDTFKLLDEPNQCNENEVLKSDSSNKSATNFTGNKPCGDDEMIECLVSLDTDSFSMTPSRNIISCSETPPRHTISGTRTSLRNPISCTETPLGNIIPCPETPDSLGREIDESFKTPNLHDILDNLNKPKHPVEENRVNNFDTPKITGEKEVSLKNLPQNSTTGKTKNRSFQDRANSFETPVKSGDKSRSKSPLVDLSNFGDSLLYTPEPCYKDEDSKSIPHCYEEDLRKKLNLLSCKTTEDQSIKSTHEHNDSFAESPVLSLSDRLRKRGNNKGNRL